MNILEAVAIGLKQVNIDPVSVVELVVTQSDQQGYEWDLAIATTEIVNWDPGLIRVVVSGRGEVKTIEML